MYDYGRALGFLDRIEKKRGTRLGLGRVKRALKLFGNPHLKVQAVHVAGTNGKGSVCAFSARILEEAGYRVGLYTSPYIFTPAEKIRINGRKIPKESYGKLILGIKKVTEKKRIRLTFFEYNTVAAFVYFARNNCAFAVLETGMGGRLDATNVCRAGVSCITNVELEHEKHLGNTKEKIAREKAAIIKEKQTVITAEKNRKILDLFRRACKRKKAKLVVVRKGVDYKLGLMGEFQKINAACALEIAEAIGIGMRYIKLGLKNAFVPARFQIVSKKPLIVVDAAHNPAGMKALVEALKREFPGRRFAFVLGFSKGKDCKKMLETIAPLAKRIFVGEAKYHPIKAEKIMREAKKHTKQVFRFKNIDALADGEAIVVCGSIYFIGHIVALDL